MKIGIVGLGLIGGSIAQRATASGHSVVGCDDDATISSQALELGYITSVSTVNDMANECDIVVLCVPSRKVLEYLTDALCGTALVTDVSSVKQPILEAVSKLPADQKSRFFGGHPMAGSEQNGLDASRADLFDNRLWIMVPPEHDDIDHFTLMKEFITSLGAEHVVLSAQDHDELVAYTSHLPQLAASTLMDLAAHKSEDRNVLLRLAAGGFRDMTRIAASNAQVWLDIVHENSDAITEALDEYIAALTKIRESVKAQDLTPISELFARAKDARINLPESAVSRGDLCEVRVLIPDQPGMITRVTSLARDINIFDIEIAHSLESDRGVMSLVVGSDDNESLVSLLTAEGFSASTRTLSSSTE